MRARAEPPDGARTGPPRDLFCDICTHLAHHSYCLEDVAEDVRCPCHRPIPGAY